MGSNGTTCVGVLAALPEEAAPLLDRPTRRRTVHGLDLFEAEHGPITVLTSVAGVGKVRAARAAVTLVHAAPLRALFVVGVAGSLVRTLRPGMLVHCSNAVQADLAVRDGRQTAACERLRALWRAAAPGEIGWFVTADRPCLSPWRRLRLARAFAGPCVADMETAAAGSVAALSGVPWAALRAVSDRAGLFGGVEFQRNLVAQAPRAAATVPALLAALAREEGLS